ncbi:hypothetical protein BKA66DRAFT_414267 [Pyrenochaeta sp. MPI-SDFR-AT-0127]|nr:hypothetical protein BKA66DRAFT_414267 [Pyrenochaeta sp. MPI-SDFR-AT-0127]
MTTVHHSPPQSLTSFAIYEDPEDQEPPSPSEVYEGEMSFVSEASLPPADEVIPTIELDQELEDEPIPYRGSYTSRKSLSQPRRSSGVTHYSFISAIPSETSISSKPVAPASHATSERYTPRKERPRFRNPESVRAMQMSSPPLLPAYEASRERVKGQYKMATPSRSGRSETPVSRRSGSHRESVREHHSPRPPPTPQQAPLVLLHVTILPMQVPFSHDMMARIMPGWLVENFKLLEEKLQDIILMRRGLLIPHPRDEYELLEERILESLELKTPRLLKCGHFVAPDDDTDREEEDDIASIPDDDRTGRGSRMSGGTLTDDGKWEEHIGHVGDDNICTDCHHELKKPGKGVGIGTRKWDMRIYAANGLMRAAAWSACWNDMERCDVEISPWIPDELRKTLERRARDEQEAEKRKQMYTVELQRQIQEATVKQKILEEEAVERKRLEEMELQKSFEAAAAALDRSVEEKAAEKKRLEEVFEEKIKEAKEAVRLEVEAQALAESNAIAERFRALEDALKEQKKAESAPETRQKSPRKSSRSISGQPLATQIPLSTLLKNYVLVLLGDQRNLIILVLSVAVVFLSLNMDPAWRQQPLTPQLVGMTDEIAFSQSISTIAITTTATSISTLTVTEMNTAQSMQATYVPVSEVTNTRLEPVEELLTSSDDSANVIRVHTEDIDLKVAKILVASDDSKDEPIVSDGSTSKPDFCPFASIFEAPTAFCTIGEI